MKVSHVIMIFVLVSLFFIFLIPELAKVPTSQFSNAGQFSKADETLKLGMIWNTQAPLESNIDLLNRLEENLVMGIDFIVYPNNEILLRELPEGKLDMGIVDEDFFSNYKASLPQSQMEKLVVITTLSPRPTNEFIVLAAKEFADHYPTLMSILKDTFQSLSEKELSGLVGKPLLKEEINTLFRITGKLNEKVKSLELTSADRAKIISQIVDNLFKITGELNEKIKELE